jgi:hypothetical protein
MTHVLPLPSSLKNIIMDFLAPSRTQIEIYRSEFHEDIVEISRVRLDTFEEMPSIRELVSYLNLNLQPPVLKRQCTWDSYNPGNYYYNFPSF